MKTLTQNQLNSDLVKALQEMKKTSKEPILIDLAGDRYVVLNERDYRGWLETIHLLSSSKNASILKEAMDEAIDQSRDFKDVLKELDG